MKKVNEYFSKHVGYTSFIHAIAGMGMGMLLVHPVFGAHTMRWGITFLVIGILGHLYPYFSKK